MTIATNLQQPQWTEEEDEVLRFNYRYGNTKNVSDLIYQLRGHRRTNAGIYGRATTLRITNLRKIEWSKREEEKLSKLLSRLPLDDIAKKLHRTKSAITAKAGKLNIPIADNREGWYTQKETAEILGVQTYKIRAWVKSNELKATKHNGLVIHIEEIDLKEFILCHLSQLTGRNVDLFQVVNIIVGENK